MVDVACQVDKEGNHNCPRLLGIKGGDDRFDNIDGLYRSEEKLVEPVTRH